MIQSRTLLAAGLVLLGAATRIAPYIVFRLGFGDISDPHGMPWNVPPIGAISLFGGACLADRRVAYCVPLAAMFISDVAIGLLMGPGWGLHPLIPVVYGSYALMVFAGGWLRTLLDRIPSLLISRVLAIGGTALVAETVFFLTTNFANWVVQPGLEPGAELLYPHTLAGLTACYIAALPFFGKSLAGMAVYATVLFGGSELVGQRAVAPEAMLVSGSKA